MVAYKRRPRGGNRAVRKWEEVEIQVSADGVTTLSITDSKTGIHKKLLSDNVLPLSFSNTANVVGIQESPQSDRFL